MSDPSIQELLRELVFRLVPSLVLSGVHRYTVARDNGDGRMDLEPAPRVLHGPRLRVEQWAAPGMEAGLTVGDELAIVFLDNDVERPAIIAHVPLRRSKPASLKIDCSGTCRIGASAALVHLGSGTEVLSPVQAVGRVVRYGDQVTIPVAGAVATGTIGLPLAGAVSKVKA